MERTILVVSEHSPSQLARIVERPQGTEFMYCTDVTDIKSAELMIDWSAVDEVLVVGSILNIPLDAVIDYAKNLGATVRYWQRETLH